MGVLPLSGMESPQAPDPACFSVNTGSQTGTALPITFGKLDMPAAPTKSLSSMNDEHVRVVAQCSLEWTESEGDEEDDDDLSDCSLVPDVLASQPFRKGGYLVTFRIALKGSGDLSSRLIYSTLFTQLPSLERYLS